MVGLDRSKPYDVVGLGLNAVDYLCVVPHFPRFDSKVKMLEFKREAGGQVATALVALTRWGLATSYIGKVGEDELGRYTWQELKKEGVDITHLKVAPGATSQFAFIMVDRQTGERTIVWHRDEKTDLTPQEVSRSAVTAGRVLHLDGHEIDAAIQAARWAREEGIPVVLDIDAIHPKTAELIRAADFLIGDRNFPTAFTGNPDREAALREIASLGPREVAMTLGTEGAMALSIEGVRYRPGYKVKAVDTTGAGDLFHAGFIYGLLQGWGLSERLAFANAVAALKCRQLGGRAGIPTLEEAYRFMGENA
ncbi:MAG: ribokinase [Nitrospinae bacterium]|nr:ribokinase [Nitrospinota bacterium]